MNSPPPLKVSLHGMDERAAQLFKLFLEGPARGCCTVVPEGQQEIAIVDLDGMGSDRLWFNLRRRFAGPALVLSLREQKLRNSIWVRKPLKPEELLSAIGRLRAEFLRREAGLSADTQATSPPLSVPSPGAKGEAEVLGQAAPVLDGEPRSTSAAEIEEGRAVRAAEMMMQERRMRDCCGVMEDGVYLDPERQHELFFDPRDTLFGAMQEAIDLARELGTPVAIDGLGHLFILHPEQQRLFTEMRESFLRPICTRLRRQGQMKLRPITLEEIPPPLLTVADPRLRRLDSVLWNVALWTARGRVPVGVALDAPVQLRAWPNLTRLQLTFGAMQIAALWAKRPTELKKTAERLGIPYRYVFSFFTACQALGLVEQLEASAPMATAESSPARAQETNTERRSLLRRMLNKLGLG